MRKKMGFSQGKSKKQTYAVNQHGIVGVIGSIPFASTKPQDINSLEILEIQGSWEIIPAAVMLNGMPFLYRVIRPKHPKKFEKSLKSKKRSKASA